MFEGRVVSGKFRPEFVGCKGAWFNVNKMPTDVTDKFRQKIADAVSFSGEQFYKKVSKIKWFNNLHLIIRHPISAAKFFWKRR